MIPRQIRRPTRPRVGNGGIVARQAVMRWAWRLFRREWRQQTLVLALLTIAIAATIVSTSAAYNLAPAAGNAEFGTANQYVRFEAPNLRALDSYLAATEERLGTIEVIGHRSVSVPGSVESVEFRSQNSDGAYSGPMLALRAGRFPTGGGEVAVTDEVAATFQLDLGAVFALDGVARTVVGLVENPSDLDAEFALLASAPETPLDEVTILVEAPSGQEVVLRAPDGTAPTISTRDDGEELAAALGMLGTATVTMVLISLVATASFVVVAQRRMRQIGMLAAIGATEDHLRFVMVANGSLIGAIAALIGVAVGALGWLAAVPFIEPAVGHRIERFNVPWWLIGAGMLLAVATSTAAAWWPGRMAARIPITLALTGRPPKPQPAHRSAGLAGMLIVLGIICLALADKTNAPLIVAGTLATVVGFLLLSPAAIRALAAVARWLPIAPRLALRDLARYQARSGAALAAISLALGISAAIVVGAAAAEHASGEGNVSARQLLVWTRNANDPDGVSPFYTAAPDDHGFSPYIPAWTPAEVEHLETEVSRIAAELGASTITPLDAVLDPAVAPEPGIDGRLAVTLAREVEIGLLDVALLYVATPELLARYGLELDAVAPETDVLTVESGELWFPHLRGRSASAAQPKVERITLTYSSLPGSFLMPDALRRRGWEPTRVGWLVETSTQLTSEQLATARDLAAGAGLLIEARDQQASLATLRSRATVAGMLVALAVLAMTVGLIRSEGSADLRTLTATGATSAIRRALTAATAGALAFLGALLGIAGAYLALSAGYVDDVDALRPAPIVHLLVIAAGVPLLAAVAGWLLAGREPPILARRAIE